MTERASTAPRTLACHDLGFECEWAVRTSGPDELLARYRDHAKCAHAIDPLPRELSERIVVVSRPIA
jgi:predicted small metal-binding protein